MPHRTNLDYLSLVLYKSRPYPTFSCSFDLRLERRLSKAVKKIVPPTNHNWCLKHASPRLRDSRVHAASSQGSEPRREASATSGSTSVNEILDPGENRWNPKRLRILQNAYLRQTTRHVACREVSSFNRSKEITGSTQTRSRRSSRPAVGVAAGYCCRIAAPPRRRRQRGHWSCVRACECVRVGRYTYMITRTGSGSPLALNLCTARAWEWRGG